MHKLSVARHSTWRFGVVQCSAATGRVRCRGRGAHTTSTADETSWEDPAFRRRFLESIAADLGVQEASDWRKVTRRHVAERGGGPLLQRGSLFDALQQAFPDQGLLAHRCRRVPPSHWDSAEHRRQFVEDLASVHGVQRARDWRRVTVRHVRELGGGGLLARHGSVAAMLQAALPEQALDELECRRQVSNAYWASRENCRRFLERVATAHGVRPPEDWRNVTRKHIVEMGGKSLFGHFGTLHAALVAAFPEHSFDERRCRRVLSRGYWDVAANRRAFMEEVARVHAVRSAAGWKRVDREDVVQAGGQSLLHRYSGSMFHLLQDVYPELGLTKPEQCRAHMPNRYWHSRDNRRRFMEAVARQAGIDSSKAEHWRRLTSDELADMGGGGLLRRYGSRTALLQDLYPALFLASPAPGDMGGEVPPPLAAWVASFRANNRVRPNFWKERDNVQQFMRYAHHRLGLTSLEEWRRVSQSQVAELGGSGLLQRMDWDAMLRVAFPTATWDREALASRSKRSVQWMLGRRVQEIFAM